MENTLQEFHFDNSKSITNKKSSNCDICKAEFKSRGGLYYHKASVHEGKKPLKCDICDHIFSQNGSLKRHMLPVHDGYKTFKCEFVITALQFTMLRNHL